MIYFLSDAHLGSRAIENQEAHQQTLIAMLQHMAQDATAIYLLGDIFDFWYEYFWRDRSKEQYRPFLNTLKSLTDKGIDYALGESYTTLFSGFEITVKAAEFVNVCQTLGSEVDVIVGEVYKTEETKLVENNVNAFETGIFDTTGFDYDGTGMVVAVLDTGTDYYHTAFSTSNFAAPESKWGLTFEEISALIGDTAASGFSDIAFSIPLSLTCV